MPFPSFARVVMAAWRRRYLRCWRCGGRGLLAWMTARYRIISCVNCGERWEIPL